MESLPEEWTKQEIIDRVLAVAAKSKLRVLNPSLDVFVKHNTVLLFSDSLATLNLEEVALEKKREEEEAERKRVEELLQAG